MPRDIAHPRGTGAGHAWFDRAFQRAMVLFLSANPADHQRLRMRTLFVSAGTALLATGLLFLCYVQGVLPEDAFLRIASCIFLTVGFFYVTFRTGLNLRAADPSLTLYQMTAAVLTVAYGMYEAKGGQPVFVILLVMAFLFGVLRLTTRKLILFAFFILAVSGGVISLRWRFRPDAVDLTEEALQWLGLAMTLPWFALMGGYISGLRARLRQSNVEQRRALQTMQTNEARLADAQRIAGLGGWSYDPATRASNWSAETFRIFGLDPASGAPTGKEFLQRIHSEDRTRYHDLIHTALREGRSFDSRFRILLPTGGVRWVHSVAEPVRDAAGKTGSLTGTVIDITERKAQEDALTRAHKRAATAQATLVDAIESLTEAFALFDADDRLVLCNSRYAEIFTDYRRSEDIEGLRFEDLVRTSIAKGEVIPPAYANDVEAWVAERVRRHRDPSPTPTELELAGGRWLQITERHTEAGGIVGVRRDITERKQSEQRQAMEHAVTRLLAQSNAVAEAIPAVIRTICETLGWDCGARWRWDAEAGVLQRAESWSVKMADVREFSAANAHPTIVPSAEPGFLGKVCQSAASTWIADIASARGFARSEAASNAGLRSAIAFPIRIAGKLDGAMEFYSHSLRQPDPTLLRVLDSIGLQIGQLIARKAAQEQLQQLAHFDYLTGLPNRNLFNQLLVHALAKAKRRSAPLALLFVDLDGFKQINDTYGHDAGDHLLATFAERLGVSLRSSDVVARPGPTNVAARLGGDEFVVLIEDVVDRSDVEVVAQRILAAAAKPFELAGVEGRVGASVGISLFPDDGEDADGLMKKADAAMYAAKQAGKNTFRFYVEPAAQPIDAPAPVPAAEPAAEAA